MKRRFVWLLCAGLFTWACDPQVRIGENQDGGSSPFNRVSGNVNGTPFIVRSVAAQEFLAYRGTCQCVLRQGLVIRLSESDQACNATTYIGAAQPQRLILDLTIENAPDAGPVTPGTYSGNLSLQTPNCAATSDCGNGTNLLCGELRPINRGAVNITLESTIGRVRGTFSSSSGVSGSFDTDALCEFYDWENTSRILCTP